MILETESKTINLVLKTKKIVKLSNLLQNKNFEDIYFKSLKNSDLEALSKIIFIFAEDIDGKSSFKNSEEVYDFIDQYRAENNKSYNDIFTELAELINEEGFFTKKMTQKELEDMISNPLLGTDMNELVQKSAEKAIAKMTEEQLQNLKV